MVLVIGCNQMPRRVAGARTRHHVVSSYLILVPLLAIASILVRQLVLFICRLRTRLETPELLVPADLQPELEDQDAGGHELLLEGVDLGEGASPLAGCAESLDALHEDPPVPGAVVDGGLAVLRQHAPEPPEIMLREFLPGGSRKTVQVE